MSAKSDVAAAIEAIEEKLTAQSGYPADIADELTQIKVAVGLEKASGDDED